MRVALINSVAGFGSTGRIVYQLSCLPGVQGRIYYGRKDNLTDADTYRITDKAGNAAHVSGTFLSGRHGFYNAKETEKMVENLKAFNPDLIHLHNLHGFYLNIEVLMKYLSECGKPVIWTMHDCWAFTGHCAHYDAIGCEKWKSGCDRNCPGLNKYPYTFTAKNVARNYADKNRLFHLFQKNQLTIVTPSYWLREQLRQSFLKDQDIRTIHNGIDLSIFHPISSDFRMKNHLENSYIYLAVGSGWYKEKGLDDLAKLSHDLRDDQKLVIVGIKKNQEKDFDNNHTIFIPRTENMNELCGLYSTADALLNLTYEDTFPTVNLEAQACGCPVFTYRTGGSTETVTDISGLVIPKGDLAMMEKVLSKVARHKNDEVVRACVYNARQYDYRYMLQSYKALYEEKTGIML